MNSTLGFGLTENCLTQWKHSEVDKEAVLGSVVRDAMERSFGFCAVVCDAMERSLCFCFLLRDAMQRSFCPDVTILTAAPAAAVTVVSGLSGW